MGARVALAALWVAWVGQATRWSLIHVRASKRARRFCLAVFVGFGAFLATFAGPADAQSCNWERGGVVESSPAQCGDHQNVRLYVWDGTAWVPWSGSGVFPGSFEVSNFPASQAVSPAAGSKWRVVTVADACTYAVKDGGSVANNENLFCVVPKNGSVGWAGAVTAEVDLESSAFLADWRNETLMGVGLLVFVGFTMMVTGWGRNA